MVFRAKFRRIRKLVWRLPYELKRTESCGRHNDNSSRGDLGDGRTARRWQLPTHGSFRLCQVESGSYTVIACASFVVLGPRSFSQMVPDWSTIKVITPEERYATG